jgi:hypothetical protein
VRWGRARGSRNHREAFLLSDYPRADEASLRESCHACLENAKRLLEDGEWCSNRPSTGLGISGTSMIGKSQGETEIPLDSAG